MRVYEKKLYEYIGNTDRYQGVRKTRDDWAKEFGVSRGAMGARICRRQPFDLVRLEARADVTHDVSVAPMLDKFMKAMAGQY